MVERVLDERVRQLGDDVPRLIELSVREADELHPAPELGGPAGFQLVVREGDAAPGLVGVNIGVINSTQSYSDFEGGSTATHLYDMLGNAWEWVADEAGGAPGNTDSATAFGGSYLTYKRGARIITGLPAERHGGRSLQNLAGSTVLTTAPRWS